MSYSQPMETVIGVPDISPGYPSKGKKLGPAWSTMWTVLAESGTEFQDGKELAIETAKRYKLVPATLQAVLARAAVAGLLDREIRPVGTSVRKAGARAVYAGYRSRVHYRIKARS